MDVETTVHRGEGKAVRNGGTFDGQTHRRRELAFYEENKSSQKGERGHRAEKFRHGKCYGTEQKSKRRK